jgi:hypothetical protein
MSGRCGLSEMGLKYAVQQRRGETSSHSQPYLSHVTASVHTDTVCLCWREVGGLEKIMIITDLLRLLRNRADENVKGKQTNDGLFVLCAFQRWGATLGCLRWRNLT